MFAQDILAAEWPHWLHSVQNPAGGHTVFIRALRFREESHFFVAVDRRLGKCHCPACVVALIDALTLPTLCVAEEQFCRRLEAARHAKHAETRSRGGLLRGLLGAIKERLT